MEKLVCFPLDFFQKNRPRRRCHQKIEKRLLALYLTVDRHASPSVFPREMRRSPAGEEPAIILTIDGMMCQVRLNCYHQTAACISVRLAEARWRYQLLFRSTSTSFERHHLL